MIIVNARATAGPGEPFQPLKIERRDLEPRDILIDIAYTGICHTDISHARSEWGPTLFPLVPGHEIAGVVAEVGSAVSKFKVGDRVGVGVMVDSCRRCDACAAGKEQHCRERFIRTYNWLGKDGRPTYGGYSERLVVVEDFAVRIPEALSLKRAAPLLCAGVTVYSPLRRWQAGPGRRVAIIGFGGLGHLAVQISSKLGAATTVFELNADKEADARRMGAVDYRSTADDDTFTSLAGSFDLILLTVPASLDLDRFLSLLDIGGTLVNIGVPVKPLTINPFSLVTNNRSVAGSIIGSIAETQEMLEFCAGHGVVAQVEVVSADAIDEAFARLAIGDVRYRFVIDIATLTAG